MNYRGSYRKLVGNSKAAMLAAIEVYNKPQFQYRDECAVILLMNAWELVLKAVLSKNKQSIFYKKHRNQPYRTLSWRDALSHARPYISRTLFVPISLNLDMISTYRDDAIHFYNATRFGVFLHGLAQSAIVNYRDLVEDVFGLDFASEIDWQIMPIGVKPPLDPISYLTGKSGARMTGAVEQFASKLTRSLGELENSGMDTGRLLTIVGVKLESLKSSANADATVAVTGAKASLGQPLAIVRKQDPNVTHPLRQKDVLEKVLSSSKKSMTSYVFQAIVWQHELRDKSMYCWRSSGGELTRYSPDILRFIKDLTDSDVEAARTNYRKHLQSKRKTR